MHVLHVHGRAVGYIRVGKRDEDAYQCLASRQIDMIARWAAEHDADVFDWFFDIGVDEGEPFELRPAGSQLLGRIGRGGLDFVIVASLDTLGRGAALFDALRLVMGAKEEVGVVAVVPGPRATSRIAEPAGLTRPQVDGADVLKAA